METPLSSTWKVRRVSAASKCFLRMSLGVSGMGNSSLDTWFTGRAAQSNVWFGVLSQLRQHSVSEAVEEAQWLRSVLAEMWPSVPSSLPRSLWTVEMDSLRRPIVALSGSFNLCHAVKSDKGAGSDKRLRIVRAMLRKVFCGAQATLAFVTTATMVADALTKALVHCPSLLAAMNARHHVFVTSDSRTGVKTTLSMPSEPVPTLKMAIGSQLIRSAESHSGRTGPCTG